jgi:hypothetical protein
MRHSLMRCLMLAGLALASPALAQEETPPDKIPEPTPLNTNRFVPSGEERLVQFYVWLWPDCTPQADVVARMTTPPAHGTITFQRIESFPQYIPYTSWAACNDKKLPGLGIHYRSHDGYKGEDHASVLLIFPDGTASQLEVLLLVR